MNNKVDTKEPTPLTQLTLVEGTVTVTDISESCTGDLTTLCKKYMKVAGNIVVWMHHAVLWGRWDGSHIHWSDDSKFDGNNIIEARIFNTKKEVYVKYLNDGLVGYSVEDGESGESGENTMNIHYVDSIQPLFGEPIDSKNGFVTLADTGRKMKQVVPTVHRGQRLGLQTRNYVTASHITGQVGYSQYRYVDIVDIVDIVDMGMVEE